MRYMTIYKTVEATTPPSQEVQVAMGKLIQEMAQSGKLVMTDGSSTAPRAPGSGSRAASSR